MARIRNWTDGVGLVVITLSAMIGCNGGSDSSDSERLGTLHRDQIFEHDGQPRQFHFYEPADVSEPRPLVVTLHGGGGTIDNHIGVGRTSWPQQVWLDVADEENIFVLAPQGIENQWNDCRLECERCGTADDSGFLTRLLDALSAEYNIDTARVYVSGESNGGFMTQRLVDEHPERFAAAGVTISLVPQNNTCESSALPMPIMFQLGTEDGAVPYDGETKNAQIVVKSADASIAHWTERNGCDSTPTRTDFADLDPNDDSTAHQEHYACPSTDTEVVRVTLEGAGHVAPSVEVQVGGFWEGIVGEQNHDVELVRLYWDFFRGYARAPAE